MSGLEEVACRCIASVGMPEPLEDFVRFHQWSSCKIDAVQIILGVHPLPWLERAWFGFGLFQTNGPSDSDGDAGCAGKKSVGGNVLFVYRGRPALVGWSPSATSLPAPYLEHLPIFQSYRRQLSAARSRYPRPTRSG